VQIGAFSEASEVEAFLRDQVPPDTEVYLSTVDVPGRGRWIRIRVGRYRRRKGAVRLAEVWGERLNERPMVVAYP
jgi:cell division septation protein DedD